jgi:ubiquinone biosynthesis protein
MAKVLTLLFEVTALFEMKTRLELVMLQKTMVVVEGVARKLDPHLDMWKTAEPVVGAWIADNLGPRGRMEDTRIASAELARQVLRAPDRLAKLGRWLDSWTEESAVTEPVRQTFGGAALWWIAIALIWIAARLTFAW